MIYLIILIIIIYDKLLTYLNASFFYNFILWMMIIKRDLL